MSRIAADASRIQPSWWAVTLSQRFFAGEPARVGQGNSFRAIRSQRNFMTFPFGHSQLTVTCARLRACIVELQAGEVVLSRIVGDLDRSN